MYIPNLKRKLGKSPGDLIYIGPDVPSKTTLQLVEYNEYQFDEKKIELPENCHINQKDKAVIWLNVDGIHDAKVMETVGKIHHLHPLLLEDVMNTNQKPKIEFYDNQYVFVVLKMLVYNVYTRKVEIEHTSFVLGKSYLISFQEERSSDIFLPVLERIKASAGKTRKNGADYLLYALMDMVVDNYFLVLDQIVEQVEALEEKVIKNPTSKQLNEMYSLKRELTFMRKAIYPSREIMFMMTRENQEIELVKDQTFAYLRDLHDHITQVLDSIDSSRELMNSLVDLHLSTQGNRMNEVMKALTIISVIFLPLNLIVGFFGMNFTDMPELDYQNAQWWVVAGMGAVSLGLLIYFNFRKWL